MTRISFRGPDGAVDQSRGTDFIPQALAEPAGLLWVDFFDEPDPACESILRDIFHFHPLAIDDALTESHVPKVDDWESYLYLVLHAIGFDPSSEPQLSTRELDVFVGPNYVVTHREQAIEPLERVWAACTRDQRVMGHGSARLLYHLVDELIAAHMPVVDAIDEEMERVEELLAASGPSILPQVLRIKRSLLHLCRIVAPQRETPNRLCARRDGGDRRAAPRVLPRRI